MDSRAVGSGLRGAGNGLNGNGPCIGQGVTGVQQLCVQVVHANAGFDRDGQVVRGGQFQYLFEVVEVEHNAAVGPTIVGEGDL